MLTPLSKMLGMFGFNTRINIKPNMKHQSIFTPFSEKSDNNIIFGSKNSSDTEITSKTLTHLVKKADKAVEANEDINDCPKLSLSKGVPAEESVTAHVGQTKVTTLIDGKQIFKKILSFIEDAEDSIQIEMYEFQNLKKKTGGDLWPSFGAEKLSGFEEQQKILDALIKKRKKGVKVQVILDVHKNYQEKNGNLLKFYNNLQMLEYLKDNDIDVVPYPGSGKGGTILQHAKFLAVDSKKVIIGGMNWGNHSCANHDACVAIETRKSFKNSEVDNIIHEIFNKDWRFSWKKLGETSKKCKERYDKGKLDLPKLHLMPKNESAIKVLTTRPKEYDQIDENGSESIGDYIKNRLDTAESLKAELFVFTHKEITQKIIDRYQEAQNGGRPFKVQIMVSPDILEQFPNTKPAYNALKEAGVLNKQNLIRKFNVNKKTGQKLHSKWAVFDDKELLIGSANWSALGLETNLNTGQRGHHEIAVVISNPEIAGTFTRQFDKDWEYSENIIPTGYWTANNSSSGHLIKFTANQKPTFDRIA